MNRHIIENKIKNLKRKNKIFIIILFDFLFSLISFLVAFILIEKSLPAFNKDIGILTVALIVSAVAILLFYFISLYKDVFRFVGLKSIGRIILAIINISFVFYLLTNVLLGFSPRRLVILYAIIFSFSTISMRLFARVILKSTLNSGRNTVRVLIYGAGESGNQVLQMMKNSAEYKPVGFIDDNKDLHGLKIDGINIYPSTDAPLLVEKLNVEMILVAMPSVRKSIRRKIIFGLEDCNVAVKTLPHINTIVDGKQAELDIRDIDVTELLGREPVTPNKELFSKCIKDNTILVTGGAGSIGSELCRQILVSRPSQLIIMDNGEYSLYKIEQELNKKIKEDKLNINLVPILGSVQSKANINNIFKKYDVDTIYHAAAYKHVPLVEQNIMEGVYNNVIGTYNMAQAAIQYGVKYFTLVSTDKAVRPTNVMGASKRMSELVLQALSDEDNDTCFSIVRFGNVLGSSGSVVPLFKKQIEAGGPVTVTDPKIIRFFMTIPEAAQLVIQAGAMANGGEVYVLDMGEPVKIYDLARQMIMLSNLSIMDATNPDGNIEIEFTGLRPGEKLYEELLVGNNVSKTKHKRIMAADEVFLKWHDFKIVIEQIKTACEMYDIDQLHEIFMKAPVSYNHNGNYVDLIGDKGVKH
ncbi:MAG: polysaccharide biosynthesis protein [Rhizobiales bacterium]|nr:polysaccharide biosynthesis protein [Hyphomicrobiales bacterium]